MSKIEEVMEKYLKECDDCGCDCCKNAEYDLDYPPDIQGMLQKGWKVDRRYPIGTTIGDQACGVDEYLVRFVKDGVPRWRKFKKGV
jgi:hypothetical protein